MCVLDSPSPQKPPAKAQPIVNRPPATLRLGSAARSSLQGQGAGVSSLMMGGQSGGGLNLRQSSLNDSSQRGPNINMGSNMPDGSVLQKRLSGIRDVAAKIKAQTGMDVGADLERQAREKFRKEFETQVKAKASESGE